jgi:homospermidine synthase
MSNVTVIDFADQRAPLAPWLRRKVNFVQKKITPQTLGPILSEHLSEGDVLIDLAWNIDTRELLTWCRDHGVLYVNTSTEVWDPYDHSHDIPPTDRTLYRRHMDLRAMLAQWKTPGPTAVLEHGANPGLISHFVKQGILDIAKRCLADHKIPACSGPDFIDMIRNRRFNELAMALGIRVIHCSERDTQISNQPKEVGQFVNTWSVPGFHEEGTTTAEMGWGTHERYLPQHAFVHRDGPQNQICLARMGMNTWVRSRVPGYEIAGMVIRHGEAFTLSDWLTVHDNGKAVYRPTVHYAYCPADAAIASLHELRGNGYAMPERMRIMNDDIVSGADILGALLMGHPYKSWWTGSDLSIEEARRLVPHQNATTLQVAISVVAAVKWMIENPKRGVLLPEDLPHDEILAVAKPYLGKWISQPINWTPLDNRPKPFGTFRQDDIDPGDPWQFGNFLIDLP